jgi:hypothetical protein
MRALSLGLIAPLMMLGLRTPAAGAQRPDSGLVRPRGARFTGIIASIRTTQPIPDADVRLIYVDSVHQGRAPDGSLGEVFVDSMRSRVGITDTSGRFTIRDVAAGHYMINVRRIGFEPFEGLLTIDTAAVEMELGMNQMSALLPPIRITTSAVNRVTERLDRVGFITRSHMGTAGRFIDRAEILRRKPVYLTDILRTYGLSMSDNYTLDRIPMDWSELENYPLDLVIGVEIYPRRGTMPVEFSGTSRGRLTFTNDRGTPIRQANVLIWTFVP